MPSVSAPNLTLLRTTQHKTLLHLAVYTPAELWHAQVDAASAQGAVTFAVKNASPLGAMPATVGANFQVMFSAVGYGLNDLGETRFKSYADTGGGTGSLTVGAHNTPLADNTYITILNEIKPVAIHATLNATDVVSEDGTTGYGGGATGQNIQYHPLARMGPPACAFIDPATGLATVNFASASTAIATGATLASYAWAFPSGTPATSAVATPGNVTWNAAGQHYVSLTVTDSNGKTHKAYRPVFIYDAPGGATQPYSQVEITSLEGDVASGVWRASLKVWGAATEAEFPDNAMVVLFAEDWYGDTKTSIGGQYTNRENIVWVGYVRGDSIKKNAQYGYVEFDAQSVSGVMANLEGLAATLVTTAGTPSDWHQLSNMTYNRVAFHLLTEHSTISQIADCYLSLLTFTRDTLDLPESSLFDQLQFNVSTPTRGRCGCSAQGMFYLEENPQLIPPASRTHPNIFANSPAPNLASMSFADFRDELDFGRDMHDKVTAQVDFAAEDTAAAAIYSLAPATPWASGRGERISGIRADSQGDSNIFAGLFEGYRNNPYADVVLPLRGNYRVCDTFPPEQVQITIGAAQNKRGFAWANQRCWIKNIRYENRAGGILLSTIVVEKDAYGYPGITGNYPASPPDWPPPEPLPVEPPIEPPIGPSDMLGKGNLFYVSSLKGIAKCTGAYGTNGTDGTPVWTAINTGLAGNALKVRFMDLDPFSVSGDHFTAMWAMTDDGLYRCTGLPSAATWTQQLSLAAAAALIGQAEGDTTLAWTFTPSVRLAGFIMCAAFYTAGTKRKIYTLYSLDYGATWNCNTADYALSSLSTAGVQQGLQAAASYHADNMYYWAGEVDWRGDQTYTEGNYGSPPVIIRRAPGAGAYAFPKFTPAAAVTVSPEGHRFYSPYCDASGNIYANDDHIYIWREWAGVAAIRRMVSAFTPIWSVGYTPPAITNVGDAAMPGGGGLPGNRIKQLFSNMFNENYGIAIDDVNIWFTPNLTASPPTWTRKNAPVIGGRAFNPRYQYCVPIDKLIALFTGKNTTGGGGVAQVVLTPDFGTTFYDVTNHGGANDLDTVLGLVAGDTDGSIIQLDYFKP